MEIIPRRRVSDVPRTDVFQFFEDMHQVIRDSKTEISVVQSSNDELRILLKNERNIRKTAEASIAAAQVQIAETEDELIEYKEQVTFLEKQLRESNKCRDALTEYVTEILTRSGLDDDNNTVSHKLEPSASQQQSEGVEKQEILSAFCSSGKGILERKTTQNQTQKLTSHQQASQVAINFEQESSSGTSNQDDEVFYSNERSKKQFLATDVVKDQVMKALHAKLRAEQERSLELEDTVLELEQRLEKECNRNEEMEKDFSNKREYLKEHLRRQRVLSEKVSYESECAVKELQEKLLKIQEENVQLKEANRSWGRTGLFETSDEECQTEGGQQTQELQKRTEGRSEHRVDISSQQSQHNEPIRKRRGSHSNGSVRIQISDEQTQTYSNAENHQGCHSNDPVVVELSNQHSQTNELTDDIHSISPRNSTGGKRRYGNVTYRTHLSQMIRDGLQWFCNMGNRGGTAAGSEDI